MRGRGGAGFPAGTKWEFAARAADPDRVIVVNGDEGDPGSYIDKLLMERNPELLLEGMALAGHAVGARHGYVLVRSEYPLSTPILREAVERSPGRAGRLRGRDRRGRRLVRGRRGDRAARVAPGLPRHRLGAPAVPRRARLPRQADRRPQRRDALQHPLHRAARRGGLRGAQPGRDAGHEARLPQRPLRAARHVRGPLRHADGRDLRGARRRPARRPLDQGGPDRRARSAASCPAGSSTRRSTSTSSPPRAAWSATAASSPSTSAPTCARWRATCSSSARTRAAASASPAGSGCSARSRWSTAPATLDRDRLEALLETLELGSLCAHGGGMPAPIRSLIAHFAEELGVAAGARARPTTTRTSRRPEERREDDPGGRGA